ncbi:histidine phosphatase superfamily [Xylariaceae sp. FL1272]|nr:histidine phosphatase superfamily [Xylariaceae sp. FL1272]
MTTLVPRPPYTNDELKTLYPTGLELQLVQVLMRHGERSPVSARFQNAGLPAFWPYCNAVRQLKSAVLDGDTRQFTTFEWKRRLESFGPRDEPILAAGPKGELDGICEMGMLTDRGRQTTFELGSRLRKLYVDQLGFLPAALLNADSFYLRATPIPRANESLQETFLGLYPLHARAPNFPPPSVILRSPNDETLFPNDSNCRRFAALSRAFAQRAADRWNDTDEMAYLNKLYGKWMPEGQRVAVDSRPRLSGVMDTINSTLAHGPETRLPKEFYDKKGRDIIEKIGVEEWFAGYKESAEYRTLGIGGLMGDVVSRMVGSAEHSTADGEYEVAGSLTNKTLLDGKGATPIRFGLSGCHDTTLAAVLASLGAFDTDKWPPYTSHIAIEMFRQANPTASAPTTSSPPVESKSIAAASKTSWWSSLFSSAPRATPGLPPPGIGRKPTSDLTAGEKAKLQGYYVRLRYNDEVVKIPGCKPAGKHLDGDESFCTLEAFKSIVDKFTPKNWKQQCSASVNDPAFPPRPEPAGE